MNVKGVAGAHNVVAQQVCLYRIVNGGLEQFLNFPVLAADVNVAVVGTKNITRYQHAFHNA